MSEPQKLSFQDDGLPHSLEEWLEVARMSGICKFTSKVWAEPTSGTDLPCMETLYSWGDDASSCCDFFILHFVRAPKGTIVDSSQVSVSPTVVVDYDKHKRMVAVDFWDANQTMGFRQPDASDSEKPVLDLRSVYDPGENVCDIYFTAEANKSSKRVHTDDDDLFLLVNHEKETIGLTVTNASERLKLSKALLQTAE